MNEENNKKYIDQLSAEYLRAFGKEPSTQKVPETNPLADKDRRDSPHATRSSDQQQPIKENTTNPDLGLVQPDQAAKPQSEAINPKADQNHDSFHNHHSQVRPKLSLHAWVMRLLRHLLKGK